MVHNQGVVPSNPDEPRDSAPTPPSQGAVVRIDRVASAVVLRVSGEIDIVTAPRVQGAAEHAMADRPATLVMDLSGVSFLASAGLAMLVACQHMSDEQTRFLVIADSPATARPIELTGLAGEIEVHRSLDAALADQQ
ncbi:STAS domain-containing protein [Rhodococcus olei]|uniref:Anti-sigma factor antagonist n=1 Tax=Rhodococcus olei TaxID=2161675 RepID=A0ABP8P8K9_9NOCA